MASKRLRAQNTPKQKKTSGANAKVLDEVPNAMELAGRHQVFFDEALSS